MARHLTPDQIARVIAILREKDHDFISRGRGGSGFGHRAGQLYIVNVEEEDRQENPVTEEELRGILARIDFDDYVQRYDAWAVQAMGIDIEGPTLAWR